MCTVFGDEDLVNYIMEYAVYENALKGSLNFMLVSSTFCKVMQGDAYWVYFLRCVRQKTIHWSLNEVVCGTNERMAKTLLRKNMRIRKQMESYYAERGMALRNLLGCLCVDLFCLALLKRYASVACVLCFAYSLPNIIRDVSKNILYAKYPRLFEDTGPKMVPPFDILLMSIHVFLLIEMFQHFDRFFSHLFIFDVLSLVCLFCCSWTLITHTTRTTFRKICFHASIALAMTLMHSLPLFLLHFKVLRCALLIFYLAVVQCIQFIGKKILFKSMVVCTAMLLLIDKYGSENDNQTCKLLALWIVMLIFLVLINTPK